MSVEDTYAIRRMTCTAPVNIAVIKYWGKSSEKNMQPLNSSLSVTLSQDQIGSKTTVMLSPSFKEDRIWLDGKEETISNPRLQKVLAKVREYASQNDPESSRHHIHICSANNFPTAAGLASSASGYACLAYTLCQLFGIKDVDVSSIARMGSGSSCRSLYGGFVAWKVGSDNKSDSYSQQVAPRSHWPEIRVLILVVSASKKDVSSTMGMRMSAATSDLLKHRAESIVPRRISEIEQTIQNKDFEKFAEITMKESNQFHAVCLDTHPPLFYLNDVSRDIIKLVHAYNTFHGKNKVAYTFDAGPNACLYMLEDSVSEVLSIVKHYFPSSGGQLEVKGVQMSPCSNPEFIQSYNAKPTVDGLSYIISSEIGDGPQVLSDKESLLDSNGVPLSLATIS